MRGRDVILRLLMKEAMSGYEIKQHFASIFSYFFDASYGTIYPTLNRMEANGLIIKETVIQEGKPNKHVYTITVSGKKSFYEYMNEPIEDDTYRSDFLMRLYFAQYMDNKRTGQWLYEEIEKTKQTIHQLEADYENWKPIMTPTQEICIQIGIQTNQAKWETLQSHVHKYPQKEEGRHESL